MASKVSIPANVGQYLVSIAGKTATLSFTREWAGSPDRVISALGALTVARTAIRAGRSQQSVFQYSDGEMPDIIVPASLLRAANIKFRIAEDGETMAARHAARKQTRSFERKAARFIKDAQALGLVFRS